MTFPEVKAILIPIQSITTYSSMCLNYGASVSKKGSEIHFSELYNQVAPPCY